MSSWQREKPMTMFLTHIINHALSILMEIASITTKRRRKSQ